MHKSRLGCVIIDCQTDDLDGAADFWSQVFGYDVVRRYQPGDENYRGLDSDESQPRMLLQKVEHPSRVHLDIETDDIDQEVERLKALGAVEVERVSRWCVMAAPSGHRFCVVKHQGRGFEEKATAWP